jgi:hypothetical protein
VQGLSPQRKATYMAACEALEASKRGAPSSPRLTAVVDPFERLPDLDGLEGLHPVTESLPKITGMMGSVRLLGRQFIVQEQLGEGLARVFKARGADGKFLAMKVHRTRYRKGQEPLVKLSDAKNEFAVACALRHRAKSCSMLLDWFLATECFASERASYGYHTAIVLMPTAPAAVSLLHFLDCGEAAAAAIVHGTLGALVQLHKLGFLHADVKPDNFLLVPAETQDAQNCGSNLGLPVRVVGIDLARAIDLEVQPCRFKSGHKVNEDQYCCPEMIPPLRPFMYQIDMYGVAAIAFGLLFGYKAIEEIKAIPTDIEGVRCHMLPRSRYKTQDGKLFGVDDVDEVWHRTFAILLNGSVGATRGKTFHLKRVQSIRHELAAFVSAKKVDAEAALVSLMKESAQ